MKFIKQEKKIYHGYESQSKLWKRFAASCWALYPPLRGIVQLTTSAALRYRNWSFTNKLAPAVCFSLLIHFAAAALLIMGLSNNLLSPPNLKGLDLVWVSLDTGSKNSEIEIQNGRVDQSMITVERTAEKPTNTEKPSVKPEAAQILEATASRELTNTITLAKLYTSSASKEQTNNTYGYSANKNAGKTSNLNTVIAYPLYKENSPPVYPEIARVRGYEGIVLVSAEVLPDGRVGNMKIRKSSGYAILDQSAIEAVKPWKFEPAKKSGSPFTVWVDLPIKFILHSENSQS
ncbi:MAG: energy transducer TonB [Deltaproteobacteria bacterium]|nr:energy transducer TonB [Deltaproteobacteria bacterium]